ncbi:hypothetical protein G7046_g9355 [Stylonectria norvegica]|nr:hypothetical protein G7046_g9355 [Stylonectria norvegica]
MEQSTTPAQNAGSKIYTSLILYLYDYWVLWFSNTFVWKCPTTSVLLPLYHASLGESHLDVGVGTGYYPATALTNSPCKSITLADLNPTALATTQRRIAAAHPSVRVHTLVADAAVPLPLPATQKFDSISLFFLLHCMSGPPERKTEVFGVMRRHLAEGGVLVGSTILGRESERNWVAERLMGSYNRKGVFDNWEDSRAVFEERLRREFVLEPKMLD